MPTPNAPLGTSLRGVLYANGPAHIVHPQDPRNSDAHLDVGEALADASTRPDREGAESTLGSLDLGFLTDPSLGLEREWLGVIRGVVVNCVVRSSHDHARGDMFAVDSHTARKDLAGQDTAHRRRETHGFVDAGAEEGARVKCLTNVDIFERRESGADF